jgi:hypothetical protein
MKGSADVAAAERPTIPPFWSITPTRQWSGV